MNTVPVERSEFVSIILKHLVNISAGRMELTEDFILAQKDEGLQEILMGLLHLQEEISFQQGELKNATQLVSEREIKHRNVLNTSPVTILEVDVGEIVVRDIFHLIVLLGTTARVTSINTTGLSLFGANTEQDFLLHSKDLVKISVEQADGMLSDTTLPKLWETEAVLTSASGAQLPILVRSAPFATADGKLEAIVTIVDISEIKKLENQFHQSQKMESIGRLAGGVAHDFNNLLTVIIGYAETLASTETDEGRLERLNIISATGSRAAELTKQLLAFSRQEIIKPRILNVNRVVSDMERLLQRLIGEDVQLQFRSFADVGQIKMDKGQLEQILLNLVVNARDAMPKGGQITVETSNQELGESQIQKHFDSTPGSFVMLAVSDTGAGMSQEVQQKIFEPFFTTKGVGKGTGLGLSTVHGIVKQNSGNIWVYSEPGKGTTIKVFIPRQATVSEEEILSTGEESVMKGHETILVVEDEPSVRNIVTDTLRKNGHTVFEAANGAEAIELFSKGEHKFDLVLTDVVMPNMSGRELIDTLEKSDTNIRSLFMSGYTATAIVNHGVLEEGIAFLHKPFLPKQLLRAVRTALDDKTGKGT